MNDAEWYVSNAESGDAAGPLDSATLLERIRSGTVGEADLLWCEGMSAWQKAALFTWLLEP